LPWRRTRDPYAVWVSEIMLQQTQVAQGTPYFERFIKAFPSVEALAAAKEDRVLKLWEGLGYYTRARNLHKAAKMVVGDLGGQFPESAEAWQRLPGVGRYTAGAIASIVFGERVPVLDGNVIRVLSRLFDIEACTDDTATRKALWQLAADLVPAKHPGDFNQAMMELGARVCTPKAPQCDACPVKRHCEARAEGVQLERPVRKAKQRTPHHENAVAAIKKNGRYLLCKRPAEGLLGGMWELPAVRLRKGETHQDALHRGISEDFSIDIEVGGLIGVVTHTYSHFKVTLNVYACKATGGRIASTTHTDHKWLLPSQFDRYAIHTANRKFLHLLK
jgi:A/G-specific adenine glycosylase